MNLHIRDIYKELAEKLKDERNIYGFWEGELSSSALAGAVAIVAFKLSGKNELDKNIKFGYQWLLSNQNNDGGFGDTPQSESNVSTSLLCYAAISFCGYGDKEQQDSLGRIESYLIKENIEISENVETAILRHYGKDYTFSVPILTMLAICGVTKNFEKVPQLPFELTLLPNSLFKFFNLQVVSYAIPALVAVGIAGFKKKKRKSIVLSPIRKKAIKPAIKKLSNLVPESGGFLEAIPLTAFVNMCLISSGFSNSEMVRKGLDFLEGKQRHDGSWPIDTDLSTWVTTLSIKAYGNDLKNVFTNDEVDLLRKHILRLQYKSKHAFNQAKPGGWGWTNYSGSVPDADDTPGAILALLQLYNGTDYEQRSIIDGCNWLYNLQNRDGGIPTFCKGWGRLPFDSSCADLTGHAFLAIAKTMDIFENELHSQFSKKLRKFLIRSLYYLERNQSEDGSWLPLWFGNQKHPEKLNPVYGTAKVSLYLKDSLSLSCVDGILKEKIVLMLEKAESFLIQNQNDDGSWGAIKGIEGSYEETSLAFAVVGEKFNMDNAVKWLIDKYKNHGLQATPIGLYFASLWYDEKLYPHIYFLEALRRNIKIV